MTRPCQEQTRRHPSAGTTRGRASNVGTLSLLALLALSCATPGGPASEAALTTEDVLPDLWRFWDAHRSDPRPDQVRAFRATVIAAHPGLLGPEVFGSPPADREVEQLLVELPRLEPKLRSLWERLPGEARRVAQRFSERFPDFAWRGPLGLGLSFGRFEAVWRTVGGRRTLVLGLDALAYYRGPYANVAPLLDHALARGLLPAWSGKGTPPLWWSLWDQGFPLLVARTLNPDANDRDIGLPMAGSASDPAYLTALARRTRPLLDSTREADRKALLTGVASDSGLTAGAVLGAQVAQRVAAGGRSLDETARLNGPSLRKAIEDALKAIESPGS